MRKQDDKGAHAEDERRVTKRLLEDMRQYLERVCDWYEGGQLPGEIAAKDLIVRIANLDGELGDA